MNKTWIVVLALVLVGGAALLTMTVGAGEAQSNRRPAQLEPRPSAMGAIARGDVPRPNLEQISRETAVVPFRAPSLLANAGNDVIVHDPAALDFQSESVIAVSANLAVVGYNDMRGFLSSPSSVCGFSYSTDGGLNWTDGGRLPLAGGGDEVLGDPDIKSWVNGPTTHFFYSSLYKTAAGENSLCLHVSTDGGQSWTAPREVTVATSLTDFPDKPLIDVDLETGRIYLAWTNFGSMITVNFAYSDDQGQTWSTPTVFNSIGQGAVPRAGESSTVAYIAWLSGGTIQLARSTDNGATWAQPYPLVSNVVVPVNPVGSDRINSFPSLALDGPNVYVAYASTPVGKTGDTSDIYFLYSDDAGSTFSTPAVISRNTFLSDRSQFFPYVAVDQSSGNIALMYYDQIRSDASLSASFKADLTEVSCAISTDGGSTFSCPITLSDRPFHAETGNTLTSANLGEYSQCVFIGGTLYAAFTQTDLPLPTTNAPDTYVDMSQPASLVVPPVRMTLVQIDDKGCISSNRMLEPGETVKLQILLENASFCTNRVQNGFGTISTTNPHVTILSNASVWPRIGVIGNTQFNTNPFVLKINEGAFNDPFVEFMLNFTSDQGDIELFFELPVGQPVETFLLSEQFEGPGFPALPAGWSTENVSGAENPWVRDLTIAVSGLQSAFCRDVSFTSHSRLATPAVAAGTFDEWVLRYRTSYKLENDGPRRAWDGLSVMLEIDGQVHQAASIGLMDVFYSHIINTGDPTTMPLAGTSVWSGTLFPTFRQVEMRFRELGGSNIRVMWDVATDLMGGTDGGAWVDNVELIGIDYQSNAPLCTDLIASPPVLDLGSVLLNQTYCDSFFLVNLNQFSAVSLDSIRSGCTNPPINIDLSRTNTTVPANDSTVVVVCILPTTLGAGSCDITVYNTSSNNRLVIPVTWTSSLTVVGVKDGTPAPFNIESVSPNPFNPTTTVRFRLPEAMPVTAEVWSVRGERVRTLARERVFTAGSNAIRWDGRNDAGDAVASGVYFIRVSNRVGQKVARAVLLK